MYVPFFISFCQQNGKDWRPGAMDRLPKRATEHFEKGRELTKATKGLKRSGLLRGKTIGDGQVWRGDRDACPG